MNRNNQRLSAIAMRRKMRNQPVQKRKGKNIPLRVIKKKKRSAVSPTNGTMRYHAKKRQRVVKEEDSESDAEASDGVESSEEGVLPGTPRGLFKIPKTEQTYDDDDNSSVVEDGDENSVQEEDVSLDEEKSDGSQNDEEEMYEEQSSDSKSENETEETKENFRGHNSNEPPKTPKKNKKSKRNKVLCGNEAADESFRWLIHPTSTDTFFRRIFNKKHLYVKRSNSNYYHGLFSCKDVDKILRENDLEYKTHVDVLSYVNGKRVPLDIDESKVYAGAVWNAYNEGNSVRLRNPQAYHKSLWKLCSLLQEYFSSPVGVNMYLTPAGSQGFPPHYDDIDAFILQIEGVKQWKVYTPRSQNEVLPRTPSDDFTEEELHPPYFEVALSPGDLLYLPRGFIHQAKTPRDTHSLHLTFSTNQQNTWGDYIRGGLNRAIEMAMVHDPEFRESLPKDYFDVVGTAFVDIESKRREWFIKRTMTLAKRALGYLPVEEAADAHAVEFIHKSMPPVFSKFETARSIHGDGACVDGKAVIARKLTLASKVRFIRKRAFRLVVKEDHAQLFYTLANGLNQMEKDCMFVEVGHPEVPAVCELLQKHPEFIEVVKLPTRHKLNFAQYLYDIGFLMVEPGS